MSRDRTVGDTFFIAFTTRAFATGIPTVLAGTPVVSAYEDAGLTQITAGITLGVDHDGVVGLNMLTIVATGANGYGAGQDYQMVITTGTVGGVSVVGEVVGQFSLSLSAAAVDLANGTDGLTAIKADTAATLVDTADMQPKLGTPAADVSADIAAVKVDTAATLVDTADMQPKLGTPAADVSADIAAVKVDTAATLVDTGTTLPALLPSALVGGRMDSSVGAMASAVITSTAYAASARDAAGQATDAVDEIRDAMLPTQNVIFNFKYVWVAASDHITPVTGATGTSVTRSIDGGAFGAATGTLTEIANGVYRFAASAADMNGGEVTFRFVATGGTPGAPDDAFVHITTGGGV